MTRTLTHEEQAALRGFAKHTPGPWMHEKGRLAGIVMHWNGIATTATIIAEITKEA